jgi:hypothetical protein
MKNRILIVVLLGGSLFASAQKNTWTIGLYSGVQGQLTFATEGNYANIKQIDASTGDTTDRYGWWHIHRTIHKIRSIPPMELRIRYNITHYFSVLSGAGYGLSITQWGSNNKSKTHDIDLIGEYADSRWMMRKSVQVPLIFQYNVPLKNTGFDFFAELGMYFDCASGTHSGGIFEDTTTFHDISENKTYDAAFYSNVYGDGIGMNYLIHIGMGISYQFLSGLGLSLSGTYNVGVFSTQIVSNLKIKATNTGIIEREYDYSVLNQCQYWNVLFGVTYTFKKKEKEKKK